MTESSQLSKLTGNAKKLGQIIAATSGERKAIEREMRALKAKGLIYASTHWRDGRYLYLLYPLNGEPRKREYIGADPARIKAAQEAMQRAEQYDSLNHRLRAVDAAIMRAAHLIASAVAELQRR